MCFDLPIHWDDSPKSQRLLYLQQKKKKSFHIYNTVRVTKRMLVIVLYPQRVEAAFNLCNIGK